MNVNKTALATGANSGRGSRLELVSAEKSA